MIDSIYGGILSSRDIQWQLTHGDLKVFPIDPLTQIQPCSIDLRLGDQIIIPRGGRRIDPHRGIGVDDTPMPFEEYWLEPNGFVNVATFETVEVPSHLVGFLVGKSTLARFGLQVESAGLADPGWQGRLTLELKNLGPDTIVLRPKMFICQIYFLVMFDRAPTLLYGDPQLRSRYQGADGPETGKLESAGSAEPLQTPGD